MEISRASEIHLRRWIFINIFTRLSLYQTFFQLFSFLFSDHQHSIFIFYDFSSIEDIDDGPEKCCILPNFLLNRTKGVGGVKDKSFGFHSLNMDIHFIKVFRKNFWNLFNESHSWTVFPNITSKLYNSYFNIDVMILIIFLDKINGI